MKYNPMGYVDLDDTTSTYDIPQDHEGNPMIVPASVWKNTVINFDILKKPKTRAHSRVACYGSVVFSNTKGKIVAMGDLRDISEKSAGFEIKPVDLKLNEILYLEFLDHTHLVMNQVKVTLKRIQLAGSKIKIGVEFIDSTLAFQSRLDTFLNEKRSENQFEELEDI